MSKRVSKLAKIKRRNKVSNRPFRAGKASTALQLVFKLI